MRDRLIGATILALGLVASSVIFGQFFYRSRLPVKTIKVTGAATRRISADIVKWRLTMVRNVGVNDLKTGYTQIKNDLASLTDLLRAEGLSEDALSIQPIQTNPVFGQYEKAGTTVGYQVMQSVFVVSRDLKKVEGLALNPSALVERGIVLQNSQLEYYPSQLSEIKRALLAEATKDAEKRAAEIARSTGDRLDKIDSARVGVFQITEPYSTEVSDYGIYNTQTRDKDITVTVNVSFMLK
ncbi:MAG: SIMPL domain-containing protein [Chitinophagales bacterium]